MGYQIIHAQGEFYIVVNATVVIPLAQMLEERFSEEDYEVLSGDPDGEKVRGIRTRDTLSNFDLAFSDFEAEFRTQPIDLNFNRNAIEPGPRVFAPDTPYSYYRFAAFYRDRRVDATGFKPGTYATTYNDLHFVPSGFAAVGRYALPNPASAQYVFQIVTFDKPDLMATATPNYGQAGGGVEVYFRMGARNAAGYSFRISAG